ncbi:chondroitin AC/alginate lyase [Auriculariales sp. MPI-PUGE-AT-0066]|nr:chondroitin AC/alginate lyase [Auriculariales sp. MPI-PUGE-AT-0066]
MQGAAARLLVALVVALPTIRALSFPSTVVIDGGRLYALRQRFLAGAACSKFNSSLASLTADADKWLTKGPWSVLDKGQPAPGGTVNDYYSMAPYYWPTVEPTDDNPLGCPWKEKDGVRNPAVDVGTDRQAIGSVCYSVPSLTFGWYFTNNSDYAIHAGNILRKWFINETTAMNPNLDHGQVITCSNTGRSIGVIDFSQMYTTVLDAVAVLNTGAPGWTSSDAATFKTWNTRFQTWITNSTFGKQETAQTNNHGTFADMQRAAIALFVGDAATAKTILEDARAKRIDVQIASDGTQPMELSRTRSWHYSNFNLVAYARMAAIGYKAQVSVDLWNYVGANGQSIKKALNFLLPAASGAANWTYPELNFTRYSAVDVVHAGADAGNGAAQGIVADLPTPPKGDLWWIRPGAEQLDSIAG